MDWPGGEVAQAIADGARFGSRIPPVAAGSGTTQCGNWHQTLTVSRPGNPTARPNGQ